MHGGMTAQWSSVLDLIYEAPLGEGGWRPALTAIADLVGAESCDLSFFEPRFFVYKRWEHARIDADTIQRYAGAFMSDMRNVHPRAPIVTRLQDGQMFADSEFWSAGVSPISPTCSSGPVCATGSRLASVRARTAAN
jgi:hypothetical protein